MRPLGGKEYVVSDHLGSTRAVISDMGAILERKDYKPFGEVLATAGTGARTGYINREEDGESGLGSYGVRLYEPEYGRFTSVDVLWAEYPETSPYQYAHNNCTSFSDPSGLIVEFADDEFRAIHEVLYNAKDSDGNFIYTDYRGRYDRLNSSDITFRVRSVDVSNSDEMTDKRAGTLATDGQIVFIDIDKTKEGTYAREGTHELVHAEQFEDGKLGFIFQDVVWSSYNNSLTLEYEAYEKQTVPHPEFTGMEWVRELYLALPESSDRFIDRSLNSRYVNRTSKYFDVWYPE